MVNTLEGIGSQTHTINYKKSVTIGIVQINFLYPSFLTLMMIFAEFLDLVENHSGIFT